MQLFQTQKKPTMMVSVATTTAQPKGKIVAVSARRAAAFESARDRLNREAAEVAIAAEALRQKKKKQKQAQEPQQQEDVEDDATLGAFVRAQALERAVYEGALPRPLPCEDDDDDATAAAREDAYEAHEAAHNRERARRRGALRRLRAAYARRALPRLHVFRREAFALTRLGERLRADAARVAGDNPRGRGYRFDVKRGGDAQAKDENEAWRVRDNDEATPGFADFLRVADALTLDAERLVARMHAVGRADDARLLRVGASDDSDEDDEDAPPLPDESGISDDAETSMSEASDA
jgi:hypothetical protein